jgi:hypothetical protein
MRYIEFIGRWLYGCKHSGKSRHTDPRNRQAMPKKKIRLESISLSKPRLKNNIVITYPLPFLIHDRMTEISGL